MKGFWRRFKTYLVGVGLGLLITYIFFGDRDISFWTPQNRVLTAIDSSEVSISPKAICQLACLNLQDDKWKEVQALASVDFSESQTQEKPCPIYKLRAIYQDENYLLLWEVCEGDEKVKMLEVQKSNSICNC